MVPESFFEKYCPTAKSASKALVFTIILLSLFAVMIWDMKRAHVMSEIIHNDHTSRWAQMDDAMLGKWLSPLDLCMLKIDDPSTDLKAYKAKNCSKLATNGGVTSQKLFCNIGSSLGKPCSPPLSTRSFFTARIKDDVLGDPNAKYLSNSLKMISASRRPVVFVGDGLSKQNQDALICEIMRSDRVSVTGSMSGEGSQLRSNFTVRWRSDYHWPTLDVMYLKMTHIVEINSERKRRSRALRPRVLQNATNSSSSINISSASMVSTPTDGLSATNNTSSTSFRANTLTFEEVRRHVAALVEKHHGVVLIANIGVWYNSREKFRQEMPAFLGWLNDLGADTSHRNLVFFRETAAQHWNQSSSGYYSFEERETNNGSCTPVADSTPEFDWRNHDVYHILQNEGLESVHTIPFRDLTLPLYNMHPSVVGGEQDCTHYCYFPQMWQSVWYDVHSVVFNSTSLRRRQLVSSTQHRRH